jgi:endonuclease/exonuclease/phosphatase family metal-dependent hydrolase
MSVRLATFNVWGIPPPVGRLVDARMAEIAARLPALEIDVLACQEVWTEGAREALIAGGRAAGLARVWHREQTFGGSGLLVLSRWPLREQRFHPYKLSGLPQRIQHSDYWGGKGFAQLVVATPDGELELIDTHLHAAYGHSGLDDEYIGHRVAELVELAAEVATTARPVAVLGDLNCDGESNQLAIFLGLTGLRDSAAELDARVPTVVAGPPYNTGTEAPGPRIDFVLLRSGADRGLRAQSARRAFDEALTLEGEDARLSDHAGMIVDVDLGGPGSPLPAPSLDSLRRARELLEHGRGVARARQSAQRGLAAASGALALAAGIAGARLSRRDWLRGTLRAGAALALLPTFGWLGLGEGFTPVELRAYQEVVELTALFERLAAERASR